MPDDPELWNATLVPALPERIRLSAPDERDPELAAASLGLPARYEALARLGEGAMGEVWRVRDRQLGRRCALKMLRGSLAKRPGLVGRFVEEAQVAAQLQHPNIAPIYDAGMLADGRVWFSMKEVHGETLGALITGAHQGWAELEEDEIRHLCDLFVKVCDGVGYAHARGVVHRDLKPENVMIGAHGEVLVLDWGLAKVVGHTDWVAQQLEPEVVTGRSEDASLKTQQGRVLGTVAYMPPEQARGDSSAHDARSDVFSLGAILYEILSGRPPFSGPTIHAALINVMSGQYPPLSPGLPDELVSLVTTCMDPDSLLRPPSGEAVAEAVRAWLDGAKKRELALASLATAEALALKIVVLQSTMHTARTRGDALLEACPSWGPEHDKHKGWSLLDEADAMAQSLARLDVEQEALLQGALNHCPGLPEAHEALLQRELERHQRAEANRDLALAVRAETGIRIHAEALPEGHPSRAHAQEYLDGGGFLTLHTDVPADVELLRFEGKRRLVATPVRSLGRSPLDRVPLPLGSYLVVIRHPERVTVRYPVQIGRSAHWDGTPPGESEVHTLALPHRDAVRSDAVVVPAGWFWAGGDPDAIESLSRRRLWCDTFVMMRHSVTNQEYITFLDDLVARGDEDQALRHVPRERSLGEGAVVFSRDAAGRFLLQPDAEGDVWDPESPVSLIDWFSAVAYAAWFAGQSGLPWRLPGELEREKAARGVDGRFRPWGDGFNGTWCCSRPSREGRPLPARVDEFPVDESVYGVRGLGGNNEDWCGDVFALDGPTAHGGRVVPPQPELGEDGTIPRLRRGGVWFGSERTTRSASRYRTMPSIRYEGLGLRLVRSMP